MANLVYLIPFVALVYIHILVGENILLSSVAGLILIVAGISLQFLKLEIKRDLTAGGPKA